MEDFTNQSEEQTTTETTEVTETEVPSVEEETPTEEQKGITVKYMKEERFIPETDIPTYVQKGLNYDRVQEKLDQAQRQAQYLERIAQLSGYQSVDEFVQAVEQAEEQRRIQEEAARLGINEDAYREYVAPVNQELQQLRSELQQLRQMEFRRQIEAEHAQLRQKYPDFEKYEEKVFDLAITHGYSLEDAYKLASWEDRINTVKQQTEQEVLSRVTGRGEKQVIPSNDKPNTQTLNPAELSFKEIEEISQRVRRGERISF